MSESPLILISCAFSLFLKCNKNTGSGSGGGRDSGTAAAQQFPSCIKTILAELQERKEDFDKLKERIERLEVSILLHGHLNSKYLFNQSIILDHTKRAF